MTSTHHDGYIDYRNIIHETHDWTGDKDDGPGLFAGHRSGGTGSRRGTHRGTARQYVS
jgi:hypothetical protein